MAYANDVAASRRRARTASIIALPSTSITPHTEKTSPDVIVDS
jgi:hypothetical protein